MKPKIVKASSLKEFLTPEQCFIIESWGLVSSGDKAISIARARVEPGFATKAHHLEGIREIYLIVKGKGIVQIGGLEPVDVAEGDTVMIPEGTSQRITNTGRTDLVFYCVCTPAFTQECYRDEEAKTPQKESK
jgi:mannose-6-phosphate isomerase-like protein (cupin superfamily)